MGNFNEMKKHLHSVNHSNTKELIDELRCLTDENKALKMENNKLEYDLEKSRSEANRLKKGKEEFQEKADLEGNELETYKSLINTIQQESTDKSNAYESKVHQNQLRFTNLK